MTYIERMKKEHKELENKMEKLSIFLDAEFNNPVKTCEKQRVLLALQLQAMYNYLEILSERIELG
ncbi:MAG: crAss001_48 related protein [Fusobacteriaceae bacterium]